MIYYFLHGFPLKEIYISPSSTWFSGANFFSSARSSIGTGVVVTVFVFPFFFIPLFLYSRKHGNRDGGKLKSKLKWHLCDMVGSKNVEMTTNERKTKNVERFYKYIWNKRQKPNKFSEKSVFKLSTTFTSSAIPPSIQINACQI